MMPMSPLNMQVVSQMRSSSIVKKSRQFLREQTASLLTNWKVWMIWRRTETGLSNLSNRRRTYKAQLTQILCRRSIAWVNLRANSMTWCSEMRNSSNRCKLWNVQAKPWTNMVFTTQWTMGVRTSETTQTSISKIVKPIESRRFNSNMPNRCKTWIIC